MYTDQLESFDEEIILLLAKKDLYYSQKVVEKIYRYFDRSTNKTLLTMKLATMFVRDPIDLMNRFDDLCLRSK